MQNRGYWGCMRLKNLKTIHLAEISTIQDHEKLTRLTWNWIFLSVRANWNITFSTGTPCTTRYINQHSMTLFFLVVDVKFTENFVFVYQNLEMTRKDTETDWLRVNWFGGLVIPVVPCTYDWEIGAKRSSIWLQIL